MKDAKPIQTTGATAKPPPTPDGREGSTDRPDANPHVGWDERKQAGEALSRSQQTFVELVERSPFGIYVVDSAFRIAHMNASSQTGTFRNVRPVIGRDFAEAMRTLWPEPVAADIISHFRHTLDSGEPYYSPRFTNPRHDLQTVESYEWELHRMTLPDGQYGVICYYFDSTKLRDAEEALARQREELQLILDSAPALIFFKDRENRFLRVNRAFADSMGVSKEELEGRSVFDLYPREQAEAFWRDDREVLASGQPKTDIVEPMRTPAGERWVQTGKVPCRDAQGHLTGVIGFALDITERRQAEEALRESEARAKVAEAVHAERQRLTEVLNMLPAYVILLSPDYRVPIANRFFEERFGKSEGRRCYEYLFNRTEPCEVCETFKVLKTNAPLRWEWTGPDGRNYDIHDFPFTDVDGSPLIMEVGLDITERKQAEAELTKHREHLQDLVSERTVELRTSNRELARFNQAMVGRELRMIELKQEVNALCAKLGQPPRYPIGAPSAPPAGAASSPPALNP